MAIFLTLKAKPYGGNYQTTFDQHGLHSVYGNLSMSSGK